MQKNSMRLVALALAGSVGIACLAAAITGAAERRAP